MFWKNIELHPKKLHIISDFQEIKIIADNGERGEGGAKGRSTTFFIMIFLIEKVKP